MTLQRRSFLLGLGVGLLAPAIVRATSLMPSHSITPVADYLERSWRRGVRIPERIYRPERAVRVYSGSPWGKVSLLLDAADPGWEVGVRVAFQTDSSSSGINFAALNDVDPAEYRSNFICVSFVPTP